MKKEPMGIVWRFSDAPDDVRYPVEAWLRARGAIDMSINEGSRMILIEHRKTNFRTIDWLGDFNLAGVEDLEHPTKEGWWVAVGYLA